MIVGILAASTLTYNVVSRLWNYYRSLYSPLIPVGVVKELFVYPVKSCKGISVFSIYCGDIGAVAGENRDRHFMVCDGKTGRFYTGREKPDMVTIECEVRNGILVVRTKNGDVLEVNIEKVRQANIVRRARLQFNLAADGLDCGDEAAAFFSKAINEEDVRLLMFVRGLYNERTCVTDPNWWINKVPKRKEKVGFANLTPYMITTQGSLDELNSRLDKEAVIRQFRPVIVVDKCPAWDEDKWLDVQIGDAQLQCFRPCHRCLLITVDPETGEKDKNAQPLNKLREFRLVPEGKMRSVFKDSPIFGVNAGMDRPGYIHVGQTVYVRYKKSAF